jgi:dissimilatory sulfite reductase related protein
MDTIATNATSHKFDEDGFLYDPNYWNKALAQQLADEDRIGVLSDAHWAVIHQIRDHFLKKGALIPISHVCKVNKLDPQCVASLFRNMREAWRIAGLPNPGEEAKSYM